MIPLLYDKTGNTLLGTLNDTIECFVEEERNGIFELSLVYPTTDVLFNLLEKGNIIIANANDTLKNQKFRIHNTKKLMSNRVRVSARHISYDLAYDLITELKLGKQSCEYCLNEIFRNSKNSKHYKGYSNIVNSQIYEMELTNPLSAIVGKEGSIIDTFGNGAEILRDNENIHVLDTRGKDNQVTIEYRKNLLDIEVDEDTTDTYNVILPVAKYKVSEQGKTGDISNLKFYRNKSDYSTTSDGEMFIGAIDNAGKNVAKGQSVTITVYGKEYQFKTRALNPCTGTYKVPLKTTIQIVSQTTTMNVYGVWKDEKTSKYKAIRIDDGNTDATTPWNWTWADNHFILGEFSLSKEEFVSSGLINKCPSPSSSRSTATADEEEVVVIGDYIKSTKDLTFLEQDRIYPKDFSGEFKDSIPTVEKLNALATQYFIESEIDIPTLNYKISFVPLSKTTEGNGIIDNLALCDKVTVKDERYNINFKTKVIRTNFNVLKDRYEDIELNTSRNNLSNVLSSTNDKIDSLGESLNNKISDILLTPNTLPQVPNLSLENGFATIRLSWTYENQSHYEYELYASQEEGFSPTAFDLIFKGQGSSYNHSVKPSQTWYYKIRCVNKRGYATEFSNEAIGETFKVDDASTFFENAAIGSALIGSLNADVINAGTVKGQYIDAKNLSVTDGNGKRTFYVDSFGNVNIDGCTTAGNTTGNYITIDQGNYSIFNEERNCGFFGFKNFEGYTVPRLLMGMYGITKGTHNYGGLSVYPGTNNPEATVSAYIDFAYHCAEKDDYSNLKMYSNGDTKIAPIRDLIISTNYQNGAAGTDYERKLGVFTTSGTSLFNSCLEINALANKESGKGLILADRYYDEGWSEYNGQSKGYTWRTALQIQTASTGTKYVRPESNGDVRLGSTENRFYRLYAANAVDASSDRRLKENIKYMCKVPNPAAITTNEITTKDMYNFVKDELYPCMYNFIGDNELKYGFIAQDICNTKVGENIVTKEVSEGDNKNYMSYDTMNYTNALAGALKEAINEIEKLKEEIKALKGGA